MLVTTRIESTTSRPPNNVQICKKKSKDRLRDPALQVTKRDHATHILIFFFYITTVFILSARHTARAPTRAAV